MTKEILISGFGGQGVLFAGKLLAYNGMKKGQEVSWLPSYGPEMRGGTASCSVIISDEMVGSPIIMNPDILIAMNLPSLDRYEKETRAGGQIFYDSSLIERSVERTDVESFGIPATKLANDNNLPGLANMIMVGHMIAKSGITDLAEVSDVLTKMIPAKKANLIELNQKAISIGFNY